MSLEVHGPTLERMQEHYKARGIELNAARLRMATLPVGVGCQVIVQNMPCIRHSRAGILLCMLLKLKCM